MLLWKERLGYAGSEDGEGVFTMYGVGWGVALKYNMYNVI